MGLARVRLLAVAGSLALGLAGCHPSATVERTMPVASLAPYATLAVRVRSTAFAAQGHAMFLEAAVLERVGARCQFTAVARPTAAPADLVLDLNLTGVRRGGTGLLSNQNQATLETLLVLTDGRDGELLGTAKIRGKSSGMIVNGAVPEREAVDVIARTVAELLASSGCSGPRVARRAPVPPTASAPPDATPPPSDATRAEAEALNDRGKDLLYAADLAGAVAAFEQAAARVADPRYAFNLCLALGAREQWDAAVAACRRARALDPPEGLVVKIDRRLELLRHQQ